MRCTRDPAVQSRQKAFYFRFTEICDLIRRRAGNAWLTSVSGDIEVRLEATAGSSVPQQLREAGYRLVEDPPGQRLVQQAIEEQLTRKDGTIIRHIAHAGIIKVQRFSFLL